MGNVPFSAESESEIEKTGFDNVVGKADRNWHNVHCEPEKSVAVHLTSYLRKNTLDFYNFCIAVSRKKRFTHS